MLSISIGFLQRAFDTKSCEESGQEVMVTFSDQTERTPHNLQNMFGARLIDPTSSKLRPYTLARPASFFSKNFSLHN